MIFDIKNASGEHLTFSIFVALPSLQCSLFLFFGNTLSKVSFKYTKRGLGLLVVFAPLARGVGG